MFPYALLAGAQVAIGAAAIFARFALTGAQPLAVAALRLLVAAAILLVAMGIRPLSVRISRKENLRLAAAGLALGAHFGLWIASLQYTPVALSTLLVTTTPLWTALYDAVVLRRPLSVRTRSAFTTGAAGLAATVAFDRVPAPVPHHALLGDALALAGGMAIAAYLLLVRTVRARLDTRGIVTRTYAWAALTATLAALAARQLPPLPATLPSWGGILAMACISQLLGHTALNAALRWFTPSAVAFSTLLEPAIAAVLAMLVFHEALPVGVVAGGTVVLASIAVVLNDERLPAADREPA